MIGRPISNESLNDMTSNEMLLDVSVSTKIKKITNTQQISHFNSITCVLAYH
jgi:hypothetical protein